MEGYPVRRFDFPTKRYVQTLDLRDDPALLAAYEAQHAEGSAWPEILEGIRAVGILEMELYIERNHLVMIVDTPIDFDWDSAMARLATLPRQQEWEDWNAQFQDCEVGMTSDEKWRGLRRMFRLYD